MALTSCQIWLSPLVHRWPTHLLHKLEKQKKTLIGTQYTNLVHLYTPLIPPPPPQKNPNIPFAPSFFPSQIVKIHPPKTKNHGYQYT